MELMIFFLIITAGTLITFFIDDISRKLTGYAAFLTILAGIVYYASIPMGTVWQMHLLGFDLKWMRSPAGDFFAWIVLGLGLLSLMYAIKYMEGKARLGYFYAAFLVSLGAMTGVTISRDIVSLFIFWEIMTWSSFLLAIYKAYYGVETKGIKYILFSSMGAYAMLTAIVFIVHYYHTTDLNALWQAGAFGFSRHWFIPAFMLFGFAVKAAVMPFHVWAPGVYTRTPMAFTSVFSGAMSKMGIFGMLLIVAGLSRLDIGWIRFILGWAGGITAALATLQAIRQNDAKDLLAYSSIAQLGYIVTALSTGTRMGLMAALYLAVLHAAFKGALFLVAGAVEKQAGTTDFREVSGLIVRMPWTFFTALISVIALAGVPPLGGFVGKWLVYESLITETHSYFLVIVIFFASTAAFLYAYRFLFGLFLGQQEYNTENVHEASWWMLVPMLVLALISIVTGVFPGLVFRPAAKALTDLHLPSNGWQMSILHNAWNNGVDTITVGSTIVILFLLTAAFITLKGRKNTRRTGTKDISTSGEIPQPDDNLNFQSGFFQPFERAIGKPYRWSMDRIWTDIGTSLAAFFRFLRKIYTGNAQTYVFYVIVFLIILLLFRKQIF